MNNIAKRFLINSNNKLILSKLLLLEKNNKILMEKINNNETLIKLKKENSEMYKTLHIINTNIVIIMGMISILLLI